MLDYFLLIIAFIWVLAATITDLKKREVPDWLTFSLVAIALASRMIFSLIEKDPSFFLQGLLYFGLFFLLANLFYYARIFAGGDAKLLMGLGTVLATPPNFSFFSISMPGSVIPLPFVFLFNLLVIGSLYGLIFTFSIAVRYRKRISVEFRKRHKTMRIGFFLVAAVVIISLALFTKVYFLLTFAALVLILPFIHSAIKIIEEIGMISLVSPKLLAEGDWLAQEVRVGKKVIKPTWEGLNKKDLKLLRSRGKKVLVKYGIPFVPAFFFTLLATFLLGNLFELLLRILMPFF